MPEAVKQMSAVNSHVSVDCVIFGFDFEELKVLLIQRKGANAGSVDAGSWALPGNLILEDESLDQAAERVLGELTGLENIYLEQFRAFGSPDRLHKEKDVEWLASVRDNPDARVITVAYFSLVKLMDYRPNPSSFASRVEWHHMDNIPELAFDHNEIVSEALESLKARLRRRPVGFALLPPKFTLGQLQKLYEAILQIPLDKRNFRKKMLKKGILIPLDEKQQGVPHKPAQYYRFDREKYQSLTDADFDFSPIS